MQTMAALLWLFKLDQNPLRIQGIFFVQKKILWYNSTMIYEEVIETISNARRFGNLPGVEVTKVMLEKENYPAKSIPFIHVAGTNGKGSVCAFLTSVMKKSKKKVGTFVSPHLINFEERIRINGNMISKEDVTRIGNKLLQMEYGVHPTMFDYCLMMALIYFEEQGCDLMIIETGLGGKLDSTNAIGTPMISVLTKIGFDHTAYLGNTLPKIAGEKAGIIKPTTKLVIEAQDKDVEEVFLQKAKECGLNDVVVTSKNDLEKMRQLELKMEGEYQIDNAAAAYQAAKLLEIDEEIILEGLKEATWEGRMELLSKEPFLYVDGAHNSHGVQALAKSLKVMFPGEKFHFYMGVMVDKDYVEMIEELLPLSECFTTVTPDSERALDAENLADIIKKKGITADSVESVEELVQRIKNHTKPDEKNIAFGSLYYIGELKEKWLK